MLNKALRLISILSVLGLLILTTSARGCQKRGRETKIGSSIPEWFLPAPSGLTATAVSFSEIQLTWQDNSTNEDGFEIESRQGGSINYALISTLNANMISYSDIGLVPSTTYYYRVRAFNTIGDRSAWSNESSATLFPPAWLTVAAGKYHVLALTNDGRLWGWGLNSNGQLGLGDINNRSMPNPVGTETDWQTISAGGFHSLALKTNGTLWSWGANAFGQLGMGDTETESRDPYQIGDASDWSRIGAGLGHSLAIKTNGTLWVWGWNMFGQLGVGDGNIRTNPTQIITGTDADWSLLAAGYGHSISMKTDGSIWSWGYNGSSQLGLGDTINRLTPTQIGTELDWSTVTSGDTHAIASKTNGIAWAWGYNQYGQLGLGYTSSRVSTPTQIDSASDWFYITAGSFCTIGLKSNNTIWSWGQNDKGQLGLGDIINRKTPSQVETTSDWVIVTSGNAYTIAIKTDATIWVCGDNGYGQLGLGNTNNRITPTEINLAVPPPVPTSLIATVISSSQINLSWTDLSYNEIGFKIERKIGRSGTYQQIAVIGTNITSYSDISPTGFSPFTYYYYRIRAYNGYGDGDYSNEVLTAILGDWSTIAAGGGHTIALKTNGTLWSWGYNYYGQLGLGDSTNRITPAQVGTDTDWSTIAGCNAHAIASKTNCTLWSWGYNNYGQLGIGNTTDKNSPNQIGTASDWLTVKGGIYHSLGLKINGTIWSWGDNTSAQLGLGNSGATTNRTTPTQIGTDTDWDLIACGGYHTLSRKTNGTLWSCGKNNNGQLGLGDMTTNRATPTQIGTLSDWAAISAGYDHTITLRTDRTIWVWGWSWAGQLGLGNPGWGSYRTTPTQIGVGSDWSDITAGANHTIALNTNGIIWGWGNNGGGQLGLGGFGPFPGIGTPNAIGFNTDWSVIVAGGNQTLGLKRNGTILTWGQNNNGQLGLGDYTDRNVPTLVGE